MKRCTMCRQSMGDDDVLCVSCGYHHGLGRRIRDRGDAGGGGTHWVGMLVVVCFLSVAVGGLALVLLRNHDARQAQEEELAKLRQERPTVPGPGGPAAAGTPGGAQTESGAPAPPGEVTTGPQPRAGLPDRETALRLLDLAAILAGDEEDVLVTRGRVLTNHFAAPEADDAWPAAQTAEALVRMGRSALKTGGEDGLLLGGMLLSAAVEAVAPEDEDALVAFAELAGMTSGGTASFEDLMAQARKRTGAADKSTPATVPPALTPKRVAEPKLAKLTPAKGGVWDAAHVEELDMLEPGGVWAILEGGRCAGEYEIDFRQDGWWERRYFDTERLSVTPGKAATMQSSAGYTYSILLSSDCTEVSLEQTNRGKERKATYRQDPVSPTRYNGTYRWQGTVQADRSGYVTLQPVN